MTVLFIVKVNAAYDLIEISVGASSGRKSQFLSLLSNNKLVFSKVHNHQPSKYNGKTSRTEFGQQMRSGGLPAYLSLNCLLNGIVLDAILFKFGPFLRNSTRV